MNDVDETELMAKPTTGRGLGLKRLGGNAALTFIAQIAASAIGLGLSILLAHTIDAEGVRVYGIALLLPNTLVTLLEFGIQYANVYHIGRGDVNAREVLRASLWIWGVITAIGFAIAGLILYYFGAKWFPGVSAAFMLIALVSFPPNLLQFYCQSILQGYQDFKRFNYLTVIVQATTFILSAIMLLVFHLGVAAVLVAFTIGQFLSLIITVVVLQPYLSRTPKPVEHVSWWEYGRKAVDYGWRQHLGAVIAFVNYRVDFFFVNFFLGATLAGGATVGAYYVAIQLGESMWIISKVVSTVLLPRLAELHDQETTRLQLTPLVCRLVVFLTFVAAVVVALIARPLLLLWGPKFAIAATILMWMLPGIVMWSATRIIAYDFSARGRPELNSYLAGIVCVLNIALNVILIPRIGVLGGAISTTVAYTANTLATAYLYRQFSDLPSWKLFILQPEDLRLLRDAARLALAKARRPSSGG